MGRISTLRNRTALRDGKLLRPRVRHLGSARKDLKENGTDSAGTALAMIPLGCISPPSCSARRTSNRLTAGRMAVRTCDGVVCSSSAVSCGLDWPTDDRAALGTRRTTCTRRPNPRRRIAGPGAYRSRPSSVRALICRTHSLPGSLGAR